MVACADGQSFGLQELLGLDLPRSASITAVTHVGGWRLTRADLQAAVAHKPDIKKQILEIVRQLFLGLQNVRRKRSQKCLHTHKKVVNDIKMLHCERRFHHTEKKEAIAHIL
jgi:CRP-like cAMP-binding protein